MLSLSCLPLAAALAAGPALEIRLESDKPRAGQALLALARTKGGEEVIAGSARWLGRQFTLVPEPGGRVPIVLPVTLDAAGDKEMTVTLRIAGGADLVAGVAVHVGAFSAPSDEEPWVLPPDVAALADDAHAAAERAELDRWIQPVTLGGASPRRFAGDFDPPVTAPVSGPFGARRGPADAPPSLGEAPFHGGVDYAAREKASVRTPAAGRVLAALSLPLLGETVLIDHGLGVVSLLAHLDAAAVRPGDVVRRHSVIGWCGQSGATPAPGLHYALSVHGVPVDPRPWEKLPRWLDTAPPDEPESPAPETSTSPTPASAARLTDLERPSPTASPAASPVLSPTPSASPTPAPATPFPATPFPAATPAVTPDFGTEDLVRLLQVGIEARLPGARVEIESAESPRERSKEPVVDLALRFTELGRFPFFTAVETTALVAGELTSLTRTKTNRMTVSNAASGQSVTLLTRDARQQWRERTGLATPPPADDH